MRALGIIVVCLLVGTVILHLVLNRWLLPLRRRRHIDQIERDLKNYDRILERERTLDREKRKV